MEGESGMKSGMRKCLCSVFAFALALVHAPGVFAQQSLRDKLPGSWVIASETLVLPGGKKISSWGANPYGFHSFDADGNFSQMLIRSDLPKFATRAGGTPEENSAVAKGMIAYYGKYSIDETAQTMVLKITGSTFASFNGTTSVRKIVSLTGGELRTTNTIPGSGVVAEIVWRRAK